MYIKEDFIENLLSKCDIKDVLDDFLELKQKGIHYFCSSPFSEDRTASFCVDITKQRFVDYSNGISGNVVSFLMEKEGYDYRESIEYIAKKLNEEVQYQNPELAQERLQKNEKRKSLRPILEATLRNYQDSYKTLNKDHYARIEVEQLRGYTSDIINDWRIGYAPGGDFIYNKVKETDCLKEAREIGIIGDRADKYWDRIVYPLYDKNGLLIGLAGRDLQGGKQAKWINPKSSLLYEKDKVWFALDRAKQSIVKNKEAWIVEGYNDVIAWHINGVTNTVAPCGTAITEGQIRILKKLTTTINFCMDPDTAGIKSMLKYVPIFLKEGFRVNIIELPCDPDDFSREYKRSIDHYGLVEMLSEEEVKRDSFSFLIEHYLPGNDIDNYKGAKDLCKIISTIEDSVLIEIYTEWLHKDSKVPRPTIKKWVKEFQESYIQSENDKVWEYQLPDEVKVPFKDLEKDIKKYGLFIANHKIWILYQPNDSVGVFKSVSNFEIQIIQHMQDEKFPMKLIRLRNIHGLEKIFDVLSESLNTPQQFDNAVTAHGNFLWTAGRNEFQKLRAYLFDNMGNGRKIDILGWQQEGFWVWNNKIVFPDREDIMMDDNGIFKYKDVSYYIPSANKIYKNNPYKYEAQKRHYVAQSSVGFNTYVAKMIEVHREHAISGILFTIASMFQDIVVKETGSFPLLFMFGPASSGKDQLAECCQGFFGDPQTAINLEGGVSTIKAQVREFAQFCNLICHLSEYKRGDSKTDGILKGLWDRRGYKRGNLDSHVGTESIPILSSVIMTGNDFPDAEALITRLIWLEMTKTEFSEQDIKRFESLRDITKAGVSSFTNQILKYRDVFKRDFLSKFRNFKDTLNEQIPEAKSRMLSIVAVLGATYMIFKDTELEFPFSFNEMLSHFKKSLDQQIRKLNSASHVNRWWDCFIAGMRGNREDRLQLGKDFKVEGGTLFFNFTHTFNKIQRQWSTQYKEGIISKSVMRDKLKTETNFIEDIKSMRFRPGKEEPRTSAMAFDLTSLNVKDEIISCVEWQMNESTVFRSPVTPDLFINPKESNDENAQPKLPF